MELGREFLESIQKLVDEKRPAVKVMHYSYESVDPYC
jgi:hypothetical protein